MTLRHRIREWRRRRDAGARLGQSVFCGATRGLLTAAAAAEEDLRAALNAALNTEGRWVV